MLRVQQFAEVVEDLTTEEYDLDTGDKRSCGSFSCFWKSPVGNLKYTATFGSDGAPEDFDFYHGGESLDGDCWERLETEDWTELGWELGFHFPHYYHGDRAETRWREDDETEVLTRLQDTLKALTA